jgi:polysaccharide export outer membrane protein
MKRIFSPIPVCLTLLLGLPANGLLAQQAQPTPPAGAPATTVTAGGTTGTTGDPADPQLKLSPQKALEEFEAPADAEYQIGAGDVIDLYVAGHPDLTHAYPVGPDGRITLLIAGQVSVANLSRPAAAKAIADALAAYYINPSVTVGVEKYGSNTIKIYGNVQHPGVLDYEGTQPTLLDAISRGGMVANTSSKDGLPDTCMIYRSAAPGQTQMVTVELRQLLTGGNPLSDIRLKRGDIVYVPSQQQQFVSVMGAVTHEGPVAYTPTLDVRMALAQAGGPAESAGGNATIVIVQNSTNRKITIRFKELMEPGGGSEVRLHPGDMIYVPKSGFHNFTTIFSALSPIATLATLFAVQ